MSNIIQTFPKGSGGGHVVLDTNGTAVDQEKKLQFTGLDVSDDSTNEKTEVKAVGLNADSLDDIIQSASVQGNAVAGNGLVYSTTEQIVGRWVDGKPIYQKTVQYTMPSTIGSVAVNNFANLINGDTLIALFGSSVDTNGYTACFNPWYGSRFGFVYDINNDTMSVQNNDATWICGRTAHITLQYTKTTDT
jgi:hypothetical protein